VKVPYLREPQRAKLNRWSEKLGAALRDSSPKSQNPELSKRTPLTECYRGTIPVRTPIVAMPQKAYGRPAEYVPTFGAKHRKTRYREDFNADGSGWSEIHDVIAGDLTDRDTVSAALNDVREMEGYKSRRVVPIKEIRRGDSVSVATPAMLSKSTATVSLIPKRELLQRLSKKQRRILQAYKLWLSGKTWRDVAKEMGEPEHVVYGWYHAIRSKVGRAATSRRVDLPRDENNRFVGYAKTAKK
jgi:hypothetical protein